MIFFKNASIIYKLEIRHLYGGTVEDGDKQFSLNDMLVGGGIFFCFLSSFEVDLLT